MRGFIVRAAPGLVMAALGLVMVGCVSLPAATPPPAVPAPPVAVPCVYYTKAQIQAFGAAMADADAKLSDHGAIDGFMTDYHNMRAAAGCDQ